MSGRHKHFMLVAAWAVCVVCTAGCGKQNAKSPSIGTAFAGPVTLNLRLEISPASRTIATAKHGDKLDIVQVRRRIVRVRTPSGQEGWTDSRNLLSSKQMQSLEDLNNRSAKLPAQAEATVYGTLNMHVEPYRTATSFYQLNEGSRVSVIGHRTTPKSYAPENTNALEIVRPTPVRPVKKKKEPAYPPPPRPQAPGLPAEWLELSKSRLPEPPPPPPPPPESPSETKRKKRKPKPTGPPTEDWTLVRTQDGKAGWVLSRMLVMAIPDEVAQYSEGARITSYFPLAEVNDDGVIKHHWLWTTVRDEGLPYEFQSFRVFTYVLRRHRYETAYIERNIEGYYPVEVKSGASPVFSLILRGPDGKLYKKTWRLEGYLVHKISEEPYTPPASENSSEKTDPSLTDKIRDLLDQ
jgi:SH3-like domain-containing protein